MNHQLAIDFRRLNKRKEKLQDDTSYGKDKSPALVPSSSSSIIHTHKFALFLCFSLRRKNFPPACGWNDCFLGMREVRYNVEVEVVLISHHLVKFQPVPSHKRIHFMSNFQLFASQQNPKDEERMVLTVQKLDGRIQGTTRRV